MTDLPSKEVSPATATLSSLESRELLEAYENRKPPYYLTYPDVKLLGVVGVSRIISVLIYSCNENYFRLAIFWTVRLNFPSIKAATHFYVQAYNLFIINVGPNNSIPPISLD